MAAGYRVGLYTSPHLVNFTERIRINNVPIPEARVVALAQRVRDGSCGINANDGCGPMSPTFFEVTTAMAFTYFAEEGVDIAVVEVGMGGRLDSTNVITPLVSIITNIDLEHTEFLGGTLEQIAAEKAGIVKTGVPVVTGAVQPQVLAVIEREAKTRVSRVYRLSKDFMPANIISGRAQVFDYQGIKIYCDELTINMLGRYQVDNACLALAAVECLRDAGLAVEENALRRGLAQSRWEGRMERVAERPDIYLDGAHNPASAQQLAATIRDLKSSYRKLVLVIGILGDKDFRGIVRELVPLADRVVVTKPEYSRALDVQTLAAEVRKRMGPLALADIRRCDLNGKGRCGIGRPDSGDRICTRSVMRLLAGLARS
jgi:dihydrofolate synthase/folylpolyglutamate synthase